MGDNIGNEKLVLELLNAFEKGDLVVKKYNRAVQGGGKATPSDSESDSSDNDIEFAIPKVSF